MEKQNSAHKERLRNYQVLQLQKERKLAAKQISLKKSIENNEAKIAELQSQLQGYFDAKEKKNNELEKIFSQKSKEIRDRQEKIRNFNENISATAVTLSEYESELARILDAKKQEMLESSRSLEIKSRLAYVNAEITECNFKIGEYKKEAKREQVLGAQIEKLKKKETRLSELVASGASSYKRNYSEELETAQKQRSGIEKQLQDFIDDENIEISRLTDLLNQMSAEAEMLSAELNKLRKSQDDAALDMQRIESDSSVIELRKKIAECSNKIALHNSEIDRLNNEVAEIKSKELEQAKLQGKEQEYLSIDNNIETIRKENATIDSKIVASEKSIAAQVTQKEKNEAKLREIEEAILDCNNYNAWIANNKRFSEEMYPKTLEIAARELKEDKLATTESIFDKLEKEAEIEISDRIKECKRKAEEIVDSRKMQIKGAIREASVNSLAQSLIKKCIKKHIEETIEEGKSETWNKEFRRIRDLRLQNLEKNIAEAEKKLSANKSSSEAKNALDEAKVAKEMFFKSETDNTLLFIKNVRKYFPVDKTFFGRPTRYLKAVDNVSLRIRKGKTLGIVGESGCGKTTMGRTILRLHDITDGEVVFDGVHLENLKSSQMRPLRTELQIIFQDPYSSLSPRLNIGEIIGEAVKAHKLIPKNEYKDYIMGVMKSCGLQPHHFSRFPHEFSGGQRQRICIARALAVNPKVVICDEPVSALDVSIQAQIINLLKDLQKTRKLTYIFISHDLSVVEHISDDVGVMYLGSMVESGPKEKIFDNPMHPYTEALLSAVPVPDPNVKMNRIFLKGDIPSPSRPPRGCKFHTRCHKCMDVCKVMPPVYREYEEDHFVACHLYPQE